MNRKNIVVSGASKGIGKAIVERFLAAGFDVAFCARNAKVLNQLKNEYSEKYPEQKVLAIACDVSNKEEVELFAEQVLFEFEAIDILVNNAGIFKPGSVSEEEDGVFEELIQTNLSSAYHLTRALLPAMVNRKDHSHIFSMCSTASIMAYVNGGSYCISKFALLGMTKVLREELKTQNTLVTAILPGATYTDSWQGSDLPAERFIPAEHIAETVFHCWSMGPHADVEELVIRPRLGDL
ncbi:MAG: SDR family oxidoreductase [Bacteroidetes bacterium]|nr:MAG: SDR family oxidoreductase [Bacteroidota bacterium]